MSQNSILASRLAAARKAKDYTQEDIADFLKCGRATITNYESGRRSPDFETLVKLAKKYNVTTDYLLGLTETETTDKDLRYVCDYTGLSAEAVKELHIIKGLADDKHCNKDHLLIIAEEKEHCKNYLYYMSEIILDLSIHQITLEISRYIDLMEKFRSLETELERDGVDSDEYFECKDELDYTLFKISKNLQDVVMDLCKKGVKNGND